MATIPSKRLHNNLNWIATAASHQTPQRAAPAETIAKPILAMDIELGVKPERSSDWAILLIMLLERALMGLRESDIERALV